jgi:hypothetical protein
MRKRILISFNTKHQKHVARIRVSETNKLKYVGMFATADSARLAAESVYVLVNGVHLSVEESTLECNEALDDSYVLSNGQSLADEIDDDDDIYALLDDLPDSVYDVPDDPLPVYTPQLNEPTMCEYPVTLAVDKIFDAFGITPPSLDQWQTVIKRVWHEQVYSIWPMYRQLFPNADFGTCQFTVSQFGDLSAGRLGQDSVKAMIRDSGQLQLVRTKTHEQFLTSTSPMLLYVVLHGQQSLHMMAVLRGRIHSSHLCDVAYGRRHYYTVATESLHDICQAVVNIYVIVSTTELAYSH